MRPLLSYPLIQARNFTPAQRERVSIVCLHTMEAAEKPSTAEAVARWFAGPQAPRASAHFCVDAEHTIQCVPLTSVAWAAPGANKTGIHVELAGYARQSAEEWADDFSAAMLVRAAALVAELCRECTIPVTRITAEGLRLGAPGICGHLDVSQAFKKSTHYDPGPRFPWLTFLDQVRQHFTGEELDALDRGEELAPATEKTGGA